MKLKKVEPGVEVAGGAIARAKIEVVTTTMA